MQTAIEDEARQREEVRESYNMAERRCTTLTAEIEELRSALEQVNETDNKRGGSVLALKLRKYRFG